MIEIKQQSEASWCVQITPDYAVGGFPTHVAAGDWIIRYMVQLFGEKLRVEAQKQMAGAALLKPTKQ